MQYRPWLTRSLKLGLGRIFPARWQLSTAYQGELAAKAEPYPIGAGRRPRGHVGRSLERATDGANPPPLA